MSLKNTNFHFLLVAMSLVTAVVFIFVLTLNKATSGPMKEPEPLSSVQHFKEYVASMIKEQSSKIQTLLKKIQTKAQTVLTKIENIKQDAKNSNKKIGFEDQQLEIPISQNIVEVNGDARGFNSHYSTTGYGASANANYGPPTYHHHSIGFDPINIVVSMSLLSFLLQALQGLLTRTRLPTPVIEARALNSIQNWLNKFDENVPKARNKYDWNRKYPKKYFS